jgi:hypothetical protein
MSAKVEREGIVVPTIAYLESARQNSEGMCAADFSALLESYQGNLQEILVARRVSAAWHSLKKESLRHGIIQTR